VEILSNFQQADARPDSHRPLQHEPSWVIKHRQLLDITFTSTFTYSKRKTKNDHTSTDEISKDI